MEEKLQSSVFVVYSHLNRIFRPTIFLIFVSGGGGGKFYISQFFWRGKGEMTDRIYRTNSFVHHITHTFVLAGILGKPVLAAVTYFHLFVRKATFFASLNKWRRCALSFNRQFNYTFSLTFKLHMQEYRWLVHSLRITMFISGSVSFQVTSDPFLKN